MKMEKKMSNLQKISALKEKRDYDILNMLNSISNFEIFTPFEITQSMIELLPVEVFKKPEYKFLDPCVKSGIFLREIIYKLDEHLPRKMHTDLDSGIEYDLSDKKERTTHILRNMIYGIAISELTAYVARRTLYGVMEANKDKIDEYLKSRIILNRNESAGDDDLNAYYDCNIFNTKDRKGFESEGNIFYPVNETTIDTEDAHYPFIDKTNHKIINKIKEGEMKFDVIIGNPPYQSSDGGHGASATPIYHKFVENSKRLNPKYISFIIPARWYSGGKGLDNFRRNMLKDTSIKKLIDYSNSKDCFPNVDIKGGVCYFLWDKNYNGKCEIINKFPNDEEVKYRYLNQFNIFFIRQNKSVDILEKILKKESNSISKKISPRKPFGLPTNFKNYTTKKNEGHYKIYGNKKISYVDKKIIPKIHESFKYWKVLLPYASDGSGAYPIIVLGKPIISEPYSICTETYLVTSFFKTKEEAINFASYLKTKTVRFLISLLKNTQHFTREKALFVPDLEMNILWTDQILYEYFELTKEEIKYIEETIKPME